MVVIVCKVELTAIRAASRSVAREQGSKCIYIGILRSSAGSHSRKVAALCRRSKEEYAALTIPRLIAGLFDRVTFQQKHQSGHLVKTHEQ